MSWFKRHEEQEEIPQPPEGLEGLEYSPEMTAFANWLLENPDALLPGDSGYEPEEQPRKKFLGLF